MQRRVDNNFRFASMELAIMADERLLFATVSVQKNEKTGVYGVMVMIVANEATAIETAQRNAHSKRVSEGIFGLPNSPSPQEPSQDPTQLIPVAPVHPLEPR